MIKFIKVFIFIFLFMIVFILFGCSAPGVNLAQTRTYAITKPPFQIIVSGDLSETDKIAVRQIINDLSQTSYENYKFNEKIQVTVLGSETDIENITITKPQNDGGSNEEN